MEEAYMALGQLVAQANLGAIAAPARQAIDQGIRVSLLCTLFGIERERWVWPFQERRNAQGRQGPADMLAGLLAPLGGIGYLGTLGGASDLDPMDPGPSHTVLPATLAACTACTLVDATGTPAAGDDDHVGSAVLAGVEAAWRFRSAITGARPGLGFHSPGVFGTLAAAASGARALRLDPQACLNALAIALTRVAGLGINSAASMIGMTHFGWGASHGLEAALLASQGWTASHDFQRGLATLYDADRVAIERLDSAGPLAAAALVFKRYPCNIYLNLLVEMLEEIEEKPVDRIDITLPWVPHLDCPAPRDLRQARNSAQAVAAIAGSGSASYAAFSGPPGPWVPTPEAGRLLPNVRLHMDKAAPTGLRDARVAVQASRGGSVILERERSMREMGGWGIEHARKLMGSPDPHGSIAALYEGSYMQGFAHLAQRRHAAATA